MFCINTYMFYNHNRTAELFLYNGKKIILQTATMLKSRNTRLKMFLSLINNPFEVFTRNEITQKSNERCYNKGNENENTHV